MTKPTMELFTDGACSGNPGPGGWAYILRDPATGTETEAADGEPRTTNNRMEMMSVIEGLRALPEACTVEIYSDSQYVLKGIKEWMDGWKRRGWKRAGNAPVKNVELWKVIDELRQVHTIKCHWIKGHNDHPMNERCDQLAVAAAAQYK